MADTVRTGGPPQAPNDRGSPPTDGSQSEWTPAARRVQHLRVWICRAAQEPRWQPVRHRTTRLLRRDAQVVVSVRRLTQVTRGRQTPGSDGARVTTPDERATLVDARRQ
jgi:RNA-directed DNA polymerase